jgi:hypothetical protein
MAGVLLAVLVGVLGSLISIGVGGAMDSTVQAQTPLGPQSALISERTLSQQLCSKKLEPVANPGSLGDPDYYVTIKVSALPDNIKAMLDEGASFINFNSPEYGSINLQLDLHGIYSQEEDDYYRWGVSTWWAFLHPGWEDMDWFIFYPCNNPGLTPTTPSNPTPTTPPGPNPTTPSNPNPPQPTPTPTPVSDCSGPSLIAPNNGYESDSHDIDFRWDEVTCAGQTGKYQLLITNQYGNNLFGDNAIVVSGTSHNAHIEDEYNEEPLSWKVRAILDSGYGDWSEERSFRLALEPDCPTPRLVSPTQGEPLYDRTVRLVWERSAAGCENEPFALRIRTDSNMDRAGSDALESERDPDPTTDTEYTVTIAPDKVGIDLYWTAWFEEDGSDSAPPAQTFKIVANRPPEISLDTANGSTADNILSNQLEWTFTGTVRDADNEPLTVTFHCNSPAGYCGNDGQQATIDGDTWTYTHEALAGDVEVFFMASDGKDSQQSNRVRLRIDDRPPRSTVSLNGATRPPRSGWFTKPVQVRIHATDQPRGTVLADVREVYYNVDGQGWTSQTGRTATMTVSGDGSHTVEYYAVDKAGNAEARKSISFQIDATPPTDISGVVETHGIPNDQWQKQSFASFEWDASTDSGSGLAGYQMVFVHLGNRAIVNQNFTATDARSWTPYQFGFMSGSYVLRGRAGDRAGNWSPWRDLYVIRSDNTPPTNPDTVEHLAGILSTVPQNFTRLADFRWSPAVDDGSGIDGCFVYWGTESDGVGTVESFTQANSYQNDTPLCAADERCIGYLRLKCEDQAGNLARAWTTGFMLVYRQFLDPESKNYRLHGSVVSLGGGSSATASQQMHSTIGQAVDSTPMGSPQYRLASGFEANWPLLPSVLARSLSQASTMAVALQATEPITDTAVDTCLQPRITINDDAVATNATQVTLNICATRAEQMMLSTDPTLSDAAWEPVTITRTWAITSDGNLDLPPTVFAAFRYPDGTVQQTFADTIIYDTAAPEGHVTVDEQAPRTLAFTAQDEGSGVAYVQISADASFSAAAWKAYTTTLQLAPDYAATTKYVRFRDHAGNVSEPVRIELDTQAPTGSIESAPAAISPQWDFVSLNLTAQDNLSGTLDVRISDDITFAGTTWQPFTPTVTLPISSTDEGWGVMYAQYRDTAGNESVIYGTLYGIDASRPEITAAWLTPGDTEPRTLTVQAEDLFTGVERLHMSNDPLMLEGVVTQTYTETLTWELDERKVVWVQAEDGVGNRSLLYPATIGTNGDQRIYLPLVRR